MKTNKTVPAEKEGYEDMCVKVFASIVLARPRECAVNVAHAIALAATSQHGLGRKVPYHWAIAKHMTERREPAYHSVRMV
jgi:hypothetical protein